MDLIPFLLVLALWGLIVGALARLALPGTDPMGLLGRWRSGSSARSSAACSWRSSPATGRPASGFFVAFVGSVLVLYVVRQTRGGG